VVDRDQQQSGSESDGNRPPAIGEISDTEDGKEDTQQGKDHQRNELEGIGEIEPGEIAQKHRHQMNTGIHNAERTPGSLTEPPSPTEMRHRVASAIKEVAPDERQCIHRQRNTR
jgi:hypothetical protein